MKKKYLCYFFSHLKIILLEGLWFQTKNIELVRTVVELLLEFVQDEGEVGGGPALYIQVDVVA